MKAGLLLTANSDALLSCLYAPSVLHYCQLFTVTDNFVTDFCFTPHFLDTVQLIMLALLIPQVKRLRVFLILACFAVVT